MCGIFGLVLGDGCGLDADQTRDSLERLFRLSESRGREASGIAVVSAGALRVHKDALPGTRLVHTAAYKRLIGLALEERATAAPFAAIGHSRLVTNGLQGIPANNQPVARDNVVLVHNGIVVNVDALWADLPEMQRQAEVDSEVIAALLARRLAAGDELVQATRAAFDNIEGETSVAALFADLDRMLLATNTGSLYVATNKAGTALFFASEAYICQTLTKMLPGFAGGRVIPVKPGHAMAIDLQTLAINAFPLDGAAPAVAPALAVNRRIETSEQRDADARAKIRRCTCCVLPETMPFIEFDADGVCNFCRHHQPIKVAGREALEVELAKYRRADGSRDCVVAFSGGRDSSYGLHLLRTELGMNPIAYTYDWGMVTDLARRNQARMCGKLGIEHIWVSADIRAKRGNIRRNVEAWLRRPDMGMIPLFMAGDKQFFWYANESIRKTGIKLMAFCDNPFEKTNFKIGFCGIAPYTKTDQPHIIGLKQKIQLAAYYGANFLRNPRYINRSITDTMTAFASYYVMPANFCHMFKYLPWDETEVERVLLGEYDWEIAPDTKTTWRIGDGTAPFYNFIYHTVAGFTEHDTFRSMQIREGLMSRERAMELVLSENRPRWQSIRDYAQMVGLDFGEIVRVVSAMPRLYRAD